MKSKTNQVGLALWNEPLWIVETGSLSVLLMLTVNNLRKCKSKTNQVGLALWNELYG